MGLDMYLYAQRNLPEDTDLTVKERKEFDKYGETYIGGWEFNADEERERFRELVEAAGLQDVVDLESPHAEIVSDGNDERDGFALRVCAAYWRKANQIHGWFVDECQYGIDECQISDPISREKLLELRNICARVLGKTEVAEGTLVTGYQGTAEGWKPIEREGLVIANPEIAQEFLPSRDGFFFGSTDYDEYYVQDLADTMDKIDRVLCAPDDVTFHYHSSW